MYTEAELEQARICARIFTDGLTYRLFTEIRSGKKLITTTVTEWLKPVYFEVDKTEVFATCLDGFLRELIELEEQIRKSGVLDPDTLTEVIFEKSIEHLQEGGANETGRTRLRLFCESFIVRLVRDYPKKVAVNAVEVAARVEGKTLLDAERALVSLANADKKMAIGICGSLNAVLFRPTCTEQFTKTAINIVCSIPPDERAVFIKSLVRSLANGEEQKRGAELLVMLGTRIPEFWPIWKFIKHAIADDRSYPHVKTVLAGIVKGRNRKEDAEFMKKASENIGELIWAVDECISRRGQEMYIEITFNSTFGVECLANLMELAQKRGYNQRCKDAIKEITMGSRETFHAARECAKRFEPDKDTPANDALISITAQVLEGPHWRAATSVIEYRLGKNDPEKRWRAVAFAEKVIRTLEQRNQTTCLASSEASVSNPQFVNQQITNKTAELVITRMAVAISFKRRPGVRELFDKMLEGGGNIADTAMHSIAMELFGFLGPCKRDVMDGIAEYVGAKPELEGLITEHMIKLARGDEEVRKKMRGFISGENATIRRIATIVHNISNTKTASMGRKHMDSGRGSGLDRRNGARMPA